MKISQLQADQLTDDLKTKLLYENIEDDFKKGDCIIVFGSSKAVDYRLPKAVELYQANRANKLLFTGGNVWDGKKVPEAILLKNKAIALGVSEHDILIETASTNTKENVLASLFVLDRWMPLHLMKRILIVTASYHMRRAYLTLKTYMPPWIEYSLCPADDRHTNKDNWYLNKYGRQRVQAETAKIIHYVKQGALIDEEL